MIIRTIIVREPTHSEDRRLSLRAKLGAKHKMSLRSAGVGFGELVMAIIGKESANAVTQLKERLTHPVISCERCVAGKPALYIVQSEVIDLRVCEKCAQEAQRLGLTVKPMNSTRCAD